MRRIIGRGTAWILISCFILSGSIVPSATSTDDTNGRTITLTIGGWIPGNPLPPRLIKGYTFVTVDFISRLDASVSQDRGKRQATIYANSLEITLIAGKSSVVVDGQLQRIDGQLFWDEEQLWVPLRFLAEMLG